VSLTNEIKLEVLRLIRDGSKSGAVDYLMKALGLGRSEALTLVDAAEIESRLQHQALANPDDESVLPSKLAVAVKALLANDKKIEAVKLVREKLHVSLQEALKRVEALDMIDTPGAVPSSQADSGRDPFNLMGKIFAAVGILLTCVMLFIFYLKQNTIAKSQRETGYVIDFDYSGNSSAPRIEYQWNGVRHKFQSNVYTTPPAYRLGEKVELFINKEDPSDVVINSFTGRWLAVMIVGGIGLFFFAFGILFIFISGKF
jgi:hypothetical protein